MQLDIDTIVLWCRMVALSSVLTIVVDIVCRFRRIQQDTSVSCNRTIR